MKFFICIVAIFLFFSSVHSNPDGPLNPVIDAVRECAHNQDINTEIIAAIVGGDLHALRHGANCLIDCALEKLGIFGEDSEKFAKLVERINRLANPAFTDNLLTTCVPEIGTENCKKFSNLLHCAVRTGAQTFFA